MAYIASSCACTGACRKYGTCNGLPKQDLQTIWQSNQAPTQYEQYADIWRRAQLQQGQGFGTRTLPDWTRQLSRPRYRVKAGSRPHEVA